VACKHEWHDVSTASKPEWACSKCKVLYSDMSPKRKWVGLTREERSELWCSTDMRGMPEHDYGKAIEAKLKERNYG